jgi:hypothetical protein
MQDEFDYLLYMDADTTATGKVESCLDYYVGDDDTSPPAQPLGSVVINGRTTFNCGFLAVKTNRTLFREMMAAGEADAIDFDPRFSEQAWLNAFWPRAENWAHLPPECNLLTLDYVANRTYFDSHYPHVVLLHFVASHAGGKPMVGRVKVGAGGGKIVATSDNAPSNALQALWLEAWTEARAHLGLPMAAPGNRTVAELFPLERHGR